MPRAYRLRPPTSAWHYYRRKSARGRVIVRDRAELEILLKTLAMTLRKSGARLAAFHVDATELHFVVRAGTSPLIPALGVFCHELTRRMNRRRGEGGPLFTQRARVTVFQPEAWLLPIARYVHAIRGARGPSRSWSSDGTYRRRRRMTALSTTAIVRALASRSADLLALDTAYPAYFDAPIPPREIQLIEHGSIEDSRILGDHTFISAVLRAQGPAKIGNAASESGPDDIIGRAAEVVIGRFHSLCRQCLSAREAHDWMTRTTLTQLRSRSRRMPLPLVRGMIADYVLTHGLGKCIEVERYFGLRPKSLAAGLRRRYRARALARLSRASCIARHVIPDFQGRG